MSKDQNELFSYKTIDGKLDAEAAMRELIHIANWMPKSHSTEAVRRTPSGEFHKSIFASRKAGIVALLDLIEEYINQIPTIDESVRVRFQMDEEIWNRVVNHTGFDETAFTPKLTVESEDSVYFIVEYESQEDFNLALENFGGMVEYKVLTDD